MNPFEFRAVIQGELLVNADGLALLRNNSRNLEDEEWFFSRGRPDPSGHYYVDYRRKKYYVHRIVAELFLPVPKELAGRNDLIVHHENERKEDNRVENLAWMTHGEHTSHHKAGSKHHNAKLSEEDVIEIRKLKGKENPHTVGRVYGINFKTVYKIWRGELWKNV